MAHFAARLALALVLAGAGGASAADVSNATDSAAAAGVLWNPEWRLGRATHYSAPGDVWTIHDGSCTHKYIWPDIGTGAVGPRAGWFAERTVAFFRPARWRPRGPSTA